MIFILLMSIPDVAIPDLCRGALNSALMLKKNRFNTERLEKRIERILRIINPYLNSKLFLNILGDMSLVTALDKRKIVDIE
jgi:hypothetical protein